MILYSKIFPIKKSLLGYFNNYKIIEFLTSVKYCVKNKSYSKFFKIIKKYKRLKIPIQI